MAKAKRYDESAITLFKGLEGVRNKPEMYIGVTDDMGVLTILREVLDNAVDNVSIDPKYNALTVKVRRDGYIEVHDCGPGIPVGTHKRAKVSTLRVVTSMLHAGKSVVFGVDRDVVHGVV